MDFESGPGSHLRPSTDVQRAGASLILIKRALCPQTSTNGRPQPAHRGGTSGGICDWFWIDTPTPHSKNREQVGDCGMPVRIPPWDSNSQRRET
jgi:hypothetical protein